MNEDYLYTQQPAPSYTAPEDPVPQARKSFALVSGGFAVAVIVWLALTFSASRLLEQYAPAFLEWEWGTWLMQYIPLYLIAFPLGFLLVTRVPRVVPAENRLPLRHLPALLPICYFVMICGSLVSQILNRLLAYLTGIDTGTLVLDTVLNMSFLTRLVMPVLIAPVAEEFLFRKQIIDRLHVYGEAVAIAVSAVMFGLFHGNLIQALYAVLLGLVFGYLYTRTGRLRYSIVLHMIINSISALVLPAVIESFGGLDAEVFSPDADPEAIARMITPGMIAGMFVILVILFLIPAGLILFVVYVKRVRFHRAAMELPKGKRFVTAFLNTGMIAFVLATAFEVVLSYVMRES